MVDVNGSNRELRDTARERNLSRLRRMFGAQREDVLSLGQLSPRWDVDLASLILELTGSSSVEAGRRVARLLGSADFNADRMDEYLMGHARYSSENINSTTRDHVLSSGAAAAFALLMDSRSAQIATTLAGFSVNFGAKEGAADSGATQKIWQVNSTDPRAEHSAMSGATAGIDDLFSNGMWGPGDPGGGVDQNAGCQCSLGFR